MMATEKVQHIQSTLSAIFERAMQPMTLRKARERGTLVAIDPMCVCLVASKTDMGVRILRPFTEKHKNQKEPSMLEDIQEIRCKLAKGLYDPQYLVPIFHIMDQLMDQNDGRRACSIMLATEGDRPIQIESEDFRFLLAPRASTE